MNQQPLRIDVWSDYNCPFCRLGAAGLEALQQTHAVEVRWHAFELRPSGSPPMPPEYGARIEQGRPRLNQMARELYALELNPGPFGFDSRPALIGAKIAEAEGLGEAYHARVMRAYWQEAQEIESRDALVRLAAEVGIDPARFAAGLDDPAFERLVDADIATAAQYGITAVPALVFDDSYPVSGAQPPAQLRALADRVLELRTATANQTATD